MPPEELNAIIGEIMEAGGDVDKLATACQTLKDKNVNGSEWKNKYDTLAVQYRERFVAANNPTQTEEPPKRPTYDSLFGTRGE